MHRDGVGTEWKTGQQGGHWLDGGRQSSSDSVSSARCDEPGEVAIRALNLAEIEYVFNALAS